MTSLRACDLLGALADAAGAALAAVVTDGGDGASLSRLMAGARDLAGEVEAERLVVPLRFQVRPAPPAQPKGIR